MEYLAKPLGLDSARKMLAKADTQPIKDTLARYTEEAVNEHGAFGAPWIVVYSDDGSTECYWGSDRFEAIAFQIGKPWFGPVPSTESTANL